MRITIALGLLLALLLGSLAGSAAGIPPRPASEDIEVLVLRQAALSLGCPWGVAWDDSTYFLVCIPAMGHSLDVRLQRFGSEAEARVAFETVRMGAPLQCFHGFPSFARQYDEQPGNPALPMRHRVHTWRASRWVVAAHAFDDTPYAIAPAPADASEAVFQAAIAQGLFAGGACRTHLPIIFRMPSPLPDLVISAMRIELETGGACNYTSTALGLRVWVRNIGAGDAGPFFVDVNGRTGSVPGGLAAGQMTSLWFAHGFVHGGMNHAFADSALQVAESDETNNECSEMVPIPTLPYPCTSTPTATSTPTYVPTPTATTTPTATPSR